MINRVWRSLTYSRLFRTISRWLFTVPKDGGHPVQPPCSSKYTQSHLPRTNIQMVSDHLQGWRLCNIPEQRVPVLGQPHRSKLFPDLHREPPMFQVGPIASRPGTGHHWEEPGSVLFPRSLQVFVHIEKIPPKSALLQAEQSQLSALPHRRDAPVPSPSLWPVTGLSPVCSCLPCTAEPRTWHSALAMASPVLIRQTGSPPSTSWQCSS